MPVRAMLTSHPVAVTLSHVVQRNAHLDEAHAPRLLNLHLAGAEHHQVADSRTAATYYSVSPGLPQGRLKYCHGNMSYEDFHPGPRRLARFAQRPLDSRRTLPLLRALTVLHRPGRHEDVGVATLTTGASVRPHRPPELVATSGACSH
jgi:hypothetical protein